ncbi:MAG: sigma-70 region 4 domain-containing protein [Solirubrobacteraceae bacterium]|jgi:hypothetical protein
MSATDELPPDQRATLSLLLRQRKSYAEVATLLRIDERAVRDRAQAALDFLAERALSAAGARELSPERRGELGDYLLSQQPGVAERLATRAYLAGSPQAGAWTRAVAGELAPLAATPLPEIPESLAAHPSSAERGSEEPPAPAGLAEPRRTRSSGSLPSSRLGGGLLLAAVLLAVVVAVILISGGGGGSHTASTAGASAGKASTGSSGSKTASGPKEDDRLTLTPTEPASKSVAVVEILSEGSKRAFYIAAENLPASKGFFYAIWLYNSPTSAEPLSRAPAVGSDHRLQGGALLPANAGNYSKLIVTRETSVSPTHPGPIVLSGPFSLGS